MPVVTQTSCFAARPLEAVGPDFACAIRTAMPEKASRLLLLLEAFLDLTNSTLELKDLDTPEGTERLRLFAGSIYCDLFQESSKADLSIFRRALEGLGYTNVFPDWKIAGPYSSPRPESPINEYRDRFASLPLSEERLAYWDGWQLTNLNGKRVCFRLHSMHKRVGHDFTTQFFSACESYFSARRSEAMVAVNRLDQFFAEMNTPLSEEDFQSRSWVGEFIRQFMKYYFTHMMRNGCAIRTAIDSWSDFAQFLNSAVLGKIWAKPHRAVPRPTLRDRKWEKTHIKVNPDGTATKTKLLTEVPLHISDGEAVDLIWSRIQADVDTIVKWANAEADALWSAYQNRVSIAPKGTVSRQGGTGTNTGLRARTSRSCADYLAHAAATYEAVGHTTRQEFNGSISSVYPRPFNLLARELGIANQLACVAYAVLIVRDHPMFNPSVLETLDLFDDDGTITGFTPTETGWRLTGYKRRRGEELAEVTAHVSQALANRIRQLIEVTAPLRKYLKDKNDPAWKRLFLAAPSVGARPICPGLDDRTQFADELAIQLSARIDLTDSAASDLAARFTLARLRASCGVLVYFQTRSVQGMAEALGHVRYDSRLVARYLPPILQEFFVERWVRLFQTGIVCEALKESPALLRASGFRSLEALTQFLTTTVGLSALTRPQPDAPVTDREGVRVVIGVSPELVRTLSTLVSLTDGTPKSLRATAAMCRDLGALILKNVEGDPDLRWMLEKAETLEPPHFAEEALYA